MHEFLVREDEKQIVKRVIGDLVPHARAGARRVCRVVRDSDILTRYSPGTTSSSGKTWGSCQQIVRRGLVEFLDLA